MIARSRPRTADIRRDRQQFLDIPKGQREPGI
jgi:hypothetical protein